MSEQHEMDEPLSVTITGHDLCSYEWGSAHDRRFPGLTPPAVACLDARRNGIEELQGIEHFSLLAALSVGSNGLKSLRRCQLPATLMYLDVSHNKLSNLDGLSSLPFLVHVDARDNFLQDLTGLANCCELRELHLHGNRLECLAGIQGCEALEYLTLHNNPLDSLAQLRALTVACQMQHLTLAGTPLATRTPRTQLRTHIMHLYPSMLTLDGQALGPSALSHRRTGTAGLLPLRLAVRPRPVRVPASPFAATALSTRQPARAQFSSAAAPPALCELLTAVLHHLALYPDTLLARGNTLSAFAATAQRTQRLVTHARSEADDPFASSLGDGSVAEARSMPASRGRTTVGLGPGTLGTGTLGTGTLGGTTLQEVMAARVSEYTTRCKSEREVAARPPEWEVCLFPDARTEQSIRVHLQRMTDRRAALADGPRVAGGRLIEFAPAPVALQAALCTAISLAVEAGAFKRQACPSRHELPDRAFKRVQAAGL